MRLKKYQPLKDWEILALERGKWLACFPLGYISNGISQGTRYKNSLGGKIDEDSAKMVQDLFAKYATGNYSLSSLHLYACERHNPSFTRSNIEKILKNKFYIGIMIWKGKEYPHAYGSIISKELFENAQLIFKSNNRYTFLEGKNTMSKQRQINKALEEKLKSNENVKPYLEDNQSTPLSKKISHMLEKGRWIAKPPLGYINKDKDIIIDNKTVDIVKYIFKCSADLKLGMIKISHFIESIYNIRISPQGINNILHNKFYIGIMEVKGNEYPHNYQTFITPNMFARAQQNMSKNKAIRNDNNRATKDRRKKPALLENWERITLESGKWLSLWPVGYKSLGKGSYNKNSLGGTIDNDKAHIIKEIFSCFNTGTFKYTDLAFHINKKYGMKFTSLFIKQTLQRKFYIGIMTWKGRDFPHKYETFITEEEFYKAEELMSIKPMWYKKRNDTSEITLNQLPENVTFDYQSMEPKNALFHMCKSPRSLDDIMEDLSLSLEDTQNYLLDLEIEGKIKEVGPNIWKTIF